MPASNIIVDVLICTSLVTFFAAKRFSDLEDKDYKPPSRSTTTRFRFHLALVGYVLWSWLLLGVLSLAPAAGKLVGVSADEIDGVTKVPAIFAAALLLTSLLPSVKILKQIDEAVRQWLYDQAWIPTRAAVLTTQLCACRFQGPSATAVEGPLGRAEALLAWVAAAPTTMRQQEIHRFLSHRSHADQLDQLGARLSQLKRSPGQPGEEVLLKDVCRMFARAVLATQSTERRRVAAFRDIGFDLQHLQGPDRAVLNDLSQVFLAVLLVMIAVLTAAAWNASDPSGAFLRNMTTALMVATIYGVASVLARVICRYEGPDAAYTRRWGVYLFAGLSASAAGIAISFLFKWLALTEHYTLAALSAGWDLAVQRLPYAPVSFVTGAGLAWALDQAHRRPCGSLSQRLFETGVIGALNLLAALIAWRFLVGEAARPWYVLVPTITLIGALLGMTVPHSRRRILQCKSFCARAASPAPQAEALPAIAMKVGVPVRQTG